MKKQNRKGFTIVELVIVIAVIAILAAVLIPTFAGIIDSANRSADTQLVAQINTLLVIEDVLGGGVNDAVEIQKIIKENGLKLQTKTKGQYIWYDIENKKAVLGGLDENGIVLEGAAAEPALVAEGEATSKGKFIAATSPEYFVEGYLFISTTSADKLADAIHTLRNPKGDNPEQSLKDAIAAIKKQNAVLGTNLESFMNTTAVMTEAGTFCINADNKSIVDRVIVSPDMPAVTTIALEQLADYHNVVVVDLHSGVASIDGQKATTDLEHIYFVYNSEGIAAIDKECGGPDNNLITLNERSDYLHTIYWVDCIYDPITGEATISETKNTVAEIKAAIYKFNYSFAYALKAGTDSLSYDFVGYSLNVDGSRPFALGTHEYELTDAEKYRIDEDGYLTIYRVYYTATSDFKVGEAYYSSKTVTSILADNGEASLPNGTTTITVVNTSATLGSATETNLTIPSGVELLVPTESLAKLNKALVSESFVKVDKDTVAGKTKLTIKSGVELVVEPNAKIYVDAKLYTYGTYYQSFTKEDCGVLVLEDGSKITSDGTITAYGVIRGDGEILVNDGELIEIMTIYDWYGGSNAAVAVGGSSLGTFAGLDTSGKHVVPFNEWGAENIRVNTTVKASALYKAETGILLNNDVFEDFELTSGSSTDQPLFLLDADAYIERSVSDDGDAKITIYGNASDTSKQLVIEGIVAGMGSATIDFSEIAMPLSHFDVNIAEGSTFTISKNIYKVLPGSEIVVDGTLNINGNAKVVICNSYDIQFKDKGAASSDVAAVATTKYECTFSVLEGRKTIKLTSQKMKGINIFGLQRWEKDGNPVDYNIVIPLTYSETTPAKLVVNGALNFSGNAVFAGEITSEKAGATITAASTVNGHTIPEGFYIQSAGGSFWYETYANGLYSQTVINGEQKALTAGTYTSTVTQIGDEYFCTWN